MSLLIDGYNLIHAAGILGRGVGPGGLERARQALLNFLVESFAPAERRRTTVVFDAALAPRGLPRRLKYHDIHIRFASDHADADALLEELIAEDSAPRKLVVVSSDHRVQRAARRRRASAVDSDVWFSAALRDRAARRHDEPKGEDAKPPTPLATFEVQHWLAHFLVEESTEGEDDELGYRPRDPNTAIPEAMTEQQVDEMEDPFPPGYAEDI